MECNDEDRLEKLQSFWEDELPNTHYCQFPHCPKLKWHI
jgi:hypothetical protein